MSMISNQSKSLAVKKVKISFKTIVGYIPVIVLMFVFTNCKQKDNFPKNYYQSIKFVHVIQDFQTNNGQLVEFADSINIIFHGRYLIFQRPMIRSFTDVNMNKNGDIISEKEIKADTIPYYIIYKNKQKYAYQFDSITALKPKKLNIDTFLTQTVNKGFPFYEKENSLEVEREISTDKTTMLVKYTCKNKRDESYPDSMFYYFDKRLQNVDFSFSEELDSLTNSKLVKVRYIFNAIPKGGLFKRNKFNFDIPKREIRYEIKKNKQSETKEIADFINKFISKEKILYNGN